MASTTPVFWSAPLRTNMEARITIISLLKPAKDPDGVRIPDIASTISSSIVMMSTEETSIANRISATINNPRTTAICMITS